MTKQEAIKRFAAEVFPVLAKQGKPTGTTIRSYWNDFQEHLYRNGEITKRQAYDVWVCPSEDPDYWRRRQPWQPMSEQDEANERDWGYGE